jgi:predicted transcriptional regulator
MQDLCNLLFELSNEDRLNILRELQKNPMKLSRVSERFNFTVPETARNMTRLAEASLIAKDTDGIFHLTPYGEASLQFIPSFEFLSKHRKYFRTHTISNLPPEYAAGIGALQKSELMSEISEILFHGENAIKDAQEFIWISVNEILVSSLRLFADCYARGVEVKKLMPRNAVIPPEILKLANDPVFERAARAKKLESRYLDKLDVSIVMSEKELAGIGFKNLEGKFDWECFSSSDKAALNWAKSLYLYYWERAKRE